MTAPAQWSGLAAAFPDHELIARSRTEPEVFGTIFDRYATTIHSYVSRRIGSQHADDVVADTFLTAFRLRDRYDPNQPAALPWLYGIAANLLRRLRREEVRQYKAFARTGIDPALDPGTDRVLARVAAAAEVRRLAGALAKLSARERDVITLVSQAQLSYPEVAVALEIPVGTVRSRLHTARTKIRKALQEGSDDE